MIYRFLADLVMLLHFSYVMFVVLGLVLILVGLGLKRRWARSFALRAGHLAAIAIVVLQAWAGIVCPLTRLENYLRREGGQAPYPLDFLEFWVHRVMFFSFPPWVFILAYTGFGFVVVLTWVLAPPRWPWKQGELS